MTPAWMFLLHFFFFFFFWLNERTKRLIALLKNGGVALLQEYVYRKLDQQAGR
jgi:hypothetical protein